MRLKYEMKWKYGIIYFKVEVKLLYKYKYNIYKYNI